MPVSRISRLLCNMCNRTPEKSPFHASSSGSATRCLDSSLSYWPVSILYYLRQGCYVVDSVCPPFCLSFYTRVIRGSNLFNPTQPNPYQSENLDPGPNLTHNLTDPIKTTTNLLVQERQLSNQSKEEIRDAPNYKFTKQFDANICEICLLTPWPSVSTTLVTSINSAHIKIFNSAVSDPRPNPTHQKSKNLDPTQSNPTRGLTQPMDNSVLH